METSATLFTELGFILGLATAVALLMRALHQPLIIGHIITGLIVGPVALGVLRSQETFQFFSEIGIAFLLFTVGLNLNPRVLREYGKVAIITGVGQVVITSLVGFAVAVLLGFESLPALYISVALAFSSTIIVLKLLSDKGDLEKLYAKISIGFLLVQDVIAIVLLFTIPLLAEGRGSPIELLGVLGRALLLSVIVFAVVKFGLLRAHTHIARSHELLFLLANAWGIGIAVLFREVGFSFEIGALIAGVSLSLLPSRHEIQARLFPLRDFFIVLFFIMLGSQMAVEDVRAFFFPALVFSALVLVGNPLILISIMGFMGYRRKTSLQTGFTVAQISEFSLILVALAVTLGHVVPSVLSMMTLVGLITIFGSTYLILFSDKWYRLLSPHLKAFERKKLIEQEQERKEYKLFLFGANRIGFDFIDTFQQWNRPFLVIDQDPEVIAQLAAERLDHEFGDAGDIELLESLGLSGADIIVSTIPDLETNLLILEVSRKNTNAPVFMAVAHNISNALRLYEAGATYVILPHFLGGEYASSLAKRFVEKSEDVVAIRAEHIERLKHHSARGHEHPIIERYR